LRAAELRTAGLRATELRAALEARSLRSTWRLRTPGAKNWHPIARKLTGLQWRAGLGHALERLTLRGNGRSLGRKNRGCRGNGRSLGRKDRGCRGNGLKDRGCRGNGRSLGKKDRGRCAVYRNGLAQ
jgi:hypothetical protein